MLLFPMVTRAMGPTTVKMVTKVRTTMRATKAMTVTMTSAAVAMEAAVESLELSRSFHHCKCAQECFCR